MFRNTQREPACLPCNESSACTVERRLSHEDVHILHHTAVVQIAGDQEDSATGKASLIVDVEGEHLIAVLLLQGELGCLRLHHECVGYNHADELTQ
jgi:hypothetical protein